MKNTRIKHVLIGLGLTVIFATIVILWQSALDNGKKEKITVYLWNNTLLEEYAPYIQSQIPEAEIEFRVGNNDLNYYEFLDKNGELPDIITNRRFSVHDASNLKDSLIDLSPTEAAASYHITYLNNYRNGDDSINWLPLCGEVDGIIANRDLFNKYDIPIPKDYKSFVNACQEFEKHGIRGFAGDFAYDYTCLEILQGLSIPQLTSLDGKKWRIRYEDTNDAYCSLDTKVWPGVFDRMESFIKDVHIKPSDVKLGYDETVELFKNKKAAMIRETGGLMCNELKEMGIKNTILLPYFGENDEKWLLTYPSFHVALNKELEKDEKRKKIALKVLDIMISEEGQNILAQKKDVISYRKDVELQLGKELENLKEYINSNYLYVRLASENMFSASLNAVQKMIKGEYSSQKAYKEFNKQIQRSEEKDGKSIVTFDEKYEYEFKNKGGNKAASSMANSLRQMYDSDILISQVYNFTGSVLPTQYSEKMVKYMIMQNSCMAYIGKMSGEDIKSLLKHNIENETKACNRFSLPVISGATMEVWERKNDYLLTAVKKDGKDIANDKVYKVSFLCPKGDYDKLVKNADVPGALMNLKEQETLVRDTWFQYIKQGNRISKPSEYITLNIK